ncbi:hypothetical protein AB205_0065150, partial [Aquarana catesbeiana]
LPHHLPSFSDCNLSCYLPLDVGCHLPRHLPPSADCHLPRHLPPSADCHLPRLLPPSADCHLPRLLPSFADCHLSCYLPLDVGCHLPTDVDCNLPCQPVPPNVHCRCIEWSSTDDRKHVASTPPRCEGGRALMCGPAVKSADVERSERDDVISARPPARFFPLLRLSHAASLPTA